MIPENYIVARNDATEFLYSAAQWGPDLFQAMIFLTNRPQRLEKKYGGVSLKLPRPGGPQIFTYVGAYLKHKKLEADCLDFCALSMLKTAWDNAAKEPTYCECGRPVRCCTTFEEPNGEHCDRT